MPSPSRSAISLTGERPREGTDRFRHINHPGTWIESPALGRGVFGFKNRGYLTRNTRMTDDYRPPGRARFRQQRDADLDALIRARRGDVLLVRLRRLS
jgi:hypothetical protein